GRGKKGETDQRANATEEEKGVGKGKVDEGVRRGKNGIDEGRNNNGVESGKRKGVDGIKNVEGRVVKKEEGKRGIENG
ncbi:DUF1542 domain-containing protein, partial [Staphylococcus haemolyticus]|uniref:DUF1542 domain-containing protein n=1 Tax=Staphylococcus haemolyticus TaxID=1283 RepID=UPI0011A338EC